MTIFWFFILQGLPNKAKVVFVEQQYNVFMLRQIRCREYCIMCKFLFTTGFGKKSLTIG